MVFLKRGITALLVFSLISLASILSSEKAHAKEPLVKVECQKTSYSIVATNPCVKKPVSIAEQLFTKNPLILQTEVKKNPEPVQKAPIQPQTEIATPQATLSADILFEMMNQHRAQIGLSPFEKEANVCSIAEERKDEIVHEIFVTGNLHAGFWEDNHPFFATENMIWQNSEAEAMRWWLNSPIHRAAIEGDFSYACGTCNGTVCNMIFSSLKPKINSQRLSQLVIPKPEVIKPTITVKPQEYISKTIDAEKSKLNALTIKPF